LFGNTTLAFAMWVGRFFEIIPAMALAGSLPRVARVRHVPVSTVTSLIRASTSSSYWEFLGEPGVDVLQLNLALDRLKS